MDPVFDFGVMEYPFFDRDLYFTKLQIHIDVYFLFQIQRNNGLINS